MPAERMSFIIMKPKKQIIKFQTVGILQNIFKATKDTLNCKQKITNQKYWRCYKNNLWKL